MKCGTKKTAIHLIFSKYVIFLLVFVGITGCSRSENAQYGFVDIHFDLFERTRTFTAKEYIMLLGTYSDHVVIGENMRK